MVLYKIKKQTSNKFSERRKVQNTVYGMFSYI